MSTHSSHLLERPRHRRLLRAAALVPLAALLAACGGGGDGSSDDGDDDPIGPPPPSSSVVAVALTPSSASLAVGATQQLQATVTGTSNTGVTWSSTQTGVATVSSTGIVTAVAPGITTIRAQSVADPSKSQSAAISVVTSSGGGGGTPSGTVLTSGTPVSGLSGVEDSQQLYRIVVPSGATRLEVRTTGGTGDLDLYLRQGQPPAAGAAVACASEGVTNAETCIVNNPTAGDWYVLLVAFETYSGVTLTATVTGGGAGATPGFTLAVNPSSVTVARGGSANFTVTATRTGGFVGPIDLNTEGFTTGLSGGSGITMAANLTSVSMVVNASASATPGTSTVTVRGRATGLADQTTTVTVTVPATAGNAVLTTRTAGGGDGQVTPNGGEYTPGSLLIVDAQPHLYSKFRGWTTNSTHCAGGLGGCRITVGTTNILMEARFEPITWSTDYDLEYVSTVISGTSGCRWNVKWMGAHVEFNFVKQLDGTYRGKLRFSGRRVAAVAETIGSGTCHPSDNTISRSVDFPSSGRSVSVRFESFSGSGTEFTTVGVSDLNPNTPGSTLGGISVEYTGTGRSGSGAINLLGFSQSSP